MKRREFITLLAGATAWPFGGRQPDLSIADRFIFRRKWLWDVYRYQRRGSWRCGECWETHRVRNQSARKQQ